MDRGGALRRDPPDLRHRGGAALDDRRAGNVAEVAPRRARAVGAAPGRRAAAGIVAAVVATIMVAVVMAATVLPVARRSVA
jgi:hypothetical protein